MKILYDYQAFNQNIGGVSRYYTELFKNFSDEARIILPKIFSDNIYLESEKIPHISICKKVNSEAKYTLYKLLNIIQSRIELSTIDYDIFHPTFVNPYYIGHTSKPVVITIHDLNHIKFGNLLPKSKIVEHKVKLCCNTANAIIAISEETKQDLIKYNDIPEEKIKVIYHGINQDHLHSYDIPIYKKPYIIYIGGRNSYKNFNVFIQAFSMIDKDVDLICTGNEFNSSEIYMIQKLHLSNRVHQKFVSEKELINLLCNAIAFIYPSLGEGFGLPILEAFRCGCPCIISDIMCFNEVAGNAAIYFNPQSAYDIASKINSVLTDSDLLEKLKEAGYKRMKKFSWRKTSYETEKLYSSLI